MCLFISYAQKDMQKKTSIDDRKGNLYFSIGTDYRITTIENSDEFQFLNNPDILVNTQVQNTGFAVNYNLDYFISKKLSLGFSHSLRYGIVSQEVNNISGDFGAEASQSNLIFGYHFYFDYHFKIFRNSEVFARFGRSFINRGTDFSTKRPFQETESGTIFQISPSNFAYEPWNFAIGYKKERVSFILGAYTSSNTDYQGEDTFIIPYLSFRYNLGSLWNND
jgi:hypothetical protein